MHSFMIRKMTLFAALLLLCATAHAEGDSIFHRVEAEVLPSAILHTHIYLKGDNPEMRTMNHAFSARLKYGFMKSPETQQGRIFKGAYQGVGVALHNFNPQLGNPFSAFIYQGATIKSFSRRLALNYEWNFGLTFGWKPYDAQTNPDNRVIGSRVTAYLDADFYLKWRLNRYVDFNAGFTLSHFSNGNTKLPNGGLNVAGLKAGVVCYLGRGNDEERGERRVESGERNDAMTGKKSPTEERKKKTFLSPLSSFISSLKVHTDVVLFGSWKRMAFLGVDGVSDVPAKFGVAGANINPMAIISPQFNVGASVDVLYDHSANITYDEFKNVIEYPTTWQQTAIGLSGRVEFVMPYFTINFGIGHNVVHAKGHLGGWYEVLALKTKLNRWSFIHIGYSLANFKNPNHLMLGLGIRLGKNK